MLSSLSARVWLLFAIALTVAGVVLGIGGCVIAAVGFGLSAKDMYDYPNLAMRVAGMLMVGFSILPFAVSVCAWFFYCSTKKEGKKASSDSRAYVVTSNQGAVPMTQYPYPMSAAADTRIYKPQHPQRFANLDVDDSAAPLTFSDTSSRQGPYDASSPQVITSASSFDDDQARRPKKKKGKKGGQAVSASIDEKQTMMTASSGYRT